MTRTTQRGTGALIATLLAILLSLSAVSPAFAAPDHRDDFALGRYMDRSDWGDWSSVLTQSLGVLALHRASDVAPSEAAVDLLLAQQCDDGAFPHAFRAPSTTGPGDCVGNVDTTAFAVQALDAIGEDEAVAAATYWLAATQQEDEGSFGGPDGLNSTSTGLAALALELGGYTDEAQAARDWILDLQDDCEAETPGAIPFRPGEGDDDRGVEVMSTSQAVLGLAGPGIGYIDAGSASDADPVTGCDDDPSGEFGNADEAATAFLVGELKDGDHLVVQTFESPGATIDVLFALAAVEVGRDTIDAIFDWLDDRAASYTQGVGDADDAVYAGATAKLALAAIVAEGNPRDVGGIDLIAQLPSVEVTELPEVSVTCDVETLAPGDEVDCTISGLLGGETVDVLVELNPTLLDDAVTADSSGTATFAFTVPEDATDEDEVAISVAGLGVDALADLELAITSPVSEEPEETEEAEEVEEVEQVDAVAEDDDEEDVLPETGDGLSLASGIGTASLLFGLGLVAVTQRRREVARA